MPKPKNISEYDKLRAIWYKKLEDEGFQDIEQDEDNLKLWSSRFAQQRSTKLWESKAAYYYMAGNFLVDYKFASKTEQLIWQQHSDGVSARDIAKELIKSGIQTNRTTVWQQIKRLESTMKKMYVQYDE